MQSNGIRGLLRTIAPFLFGPAARPATPRAKNRRRRGHTHYHYSHKRARTAKAPAEVPSAVLPVEAEPDVPEVPADMAPGQADMPEEPAVPVEQEEAPVEAARPEETPAAVPEAPRAVGTILTPAARVERTKEEVAREEEQLRGEKGWMEKVHSSKADHALSRWNAWSVIKERLFTPIDMPSFLRPAKRDSVPATRSLTKEEIENDTFLKRVQKKDISAPVGVEVAEEPVPAARPASTLESFAAAPADTQASAPVVKPRILPPIEKKKDEPPAVRREEPSEPAKPEPAKREEPKQEEAKPVPKIVVRKRASAFSAWVASLNYMGLGKERMMFIQNMATMLNAGLPLIDALRTIQLETRNKAMKKLLQQILVSVENGSSFWRAMDDRHFFSLHAIALVRIGEESGSLAENMAYLAQQEEKDHELRGKVKMAMIYPSIVLTIMFILVIGLGWFVLPNLIGVLFSLGVPLPLVTRMVIAFTNFFTDYGTVAVPGMVIGIIAFAVLNKIFTPLRIATQWVMFRVPGVGVLAREATIARFGVILGGLLKAGVPVIESVQSLVEVTPIISYRNLYVRMLEHISVGDSFSKSFAAIKGSDRLLPPSVQQLIITGEKSGSLADIMLKVADIYDKKASETAQKLPVVLEPMILMIIGGLVGTIAFAIIVPIYGIVGSVGR